MELINKLLYFLLAAPVIFLATPFLIKYKWIRITVFIAHAVLLTYLTIFEFNKPSWRWTEQTAMINDIKSATPDEKAYKFIWDHFVFVDNSFDKELVPNPDGDADDSTTLAITSRSRLKSFA